MSAFPKVEGSTLLALAIDVVAIAAWGFIVGYCGHWGWSLFG